MGGIYFLKSTYDNLEKVNPSVCCLAMETLWEIKAPPNFLTLSWKIIKGKTPTMMNLLRRGIILTSYLCPLCNQVDESTIHLFMECEVAYHVR